MKLKTKLYKAVKKELESLGFYSISYDNELYNSKPMGSVLTQDLDRGYFKTELNSDDSKAKISFQMLDIAPIIITL